MACTGLSHIGNETRQIEREDGGTFFHEWTTLTLEPNHKKILVTGYCAVPLKEMRADQLAFHKINWTISQDPDPKVNTNTHLITRGVVGGKSLNLDIDSNQFLDQRCVGGEANYIKLRQIGIGIAVSNGGQDPMGLVMNMVDLVRSGGSFSPMIALNTMSWVSDRHGGGASFPEFGVQFQMGQSNGRKLVIAASQGGLGNIIDVRSAGLLSYHEGDGYVDMTTDSYGMVSGFSRQESMFAGADRNGIYTNNKFQASNVSGGSQVFGCSMLNYDGELSLPTQSADLNICRRAMEPRLMGQDFKPEVAMANELTPAQEKAKITRLLIEQKASAYLDRTQGRPQAYASKPKSFEQGRIAWQSGDVDRGFVVTRRILSFNEAKQAFVVRESHLSVDGEERTLTYQLKVQDIR
jgi:hypothetical protein